MLMRCPDCDKPLQVPDDKVGRRARCSACRSVFVIPDPLAGMDETIAGWLVEDMQQVEQMKARHAALYEQLDPASRKTPAMRRA
ncbi:hypothetical protein ACERK3_04340 [Phycisphaerales bacterium AB-hyl4]|uniref:Zinc finger/thioredoxin putative domain-containing protein n=1 Tax=Natronomicrosphaera hydrolytica TaxID=3242702 RepID=A0ABV4U4V7_9BACT